MGAAPRCLDEEIEQARLGAGQDHEHVAAGAESRQQRFGRERREHSRDRRIDRVAAGAQHVSAGARGLRMAGGDDPSGHRGALSHDPPFAI